jgi:hypothetical protein
MVSFAVEPEGALHQITFVCLAAAVYFFVVVPCQAFQRRRGIGPA